MERHEWMDFMTDFTARFPSTADWLRKLPVETREIWFTDVFSVIDYRDAIQVSRQLMESDEELEAFKRERIPGIYLKRTGMIRQDREERHRELERRKQRGKYGRRDVTPVLGRIQEIIGRTVALYREQHGERMPQEELEQLVDTLFDEHDVIADDDLKLPRFKCPECLDAGFIGYRKESRPYVGHCECQRGHDMRDRFKERGRTLGSAAVALGRVVEWQYENEIEVFNDG